MTFCVLMVESACQYVQTFQSFHCGKYIFSTLCTSHGLLADTCHVPQSPQEPRVMTRVGCAVLNKPSNWVPEPTAHLSYKPRTSILGSN